MSACGPVSETSKGHPDPTACRVPTLAFRYRRTISTEPTTSATSQISISIMPAPNPSDASRTSIKQTNATRLKTTLHALARCVTV